MVRVEVEIPVFLILALYGGERPILHVMKQPPDTHWIGGWVGIRSSTNGGKRK
jgi:hypothetical protein